MNTTILVTGGTGTIGRRVLPILGAAGEHVRVLSRHPRTNEPGIEYVGADTVAGSGLRPALEGIRTVLHLAGGAKGDDLAARNLAQAATLAGVEHLVLISVVGADRMPIGYFRAKAAAEETIAESKVPWTIVRAAQLNEFVLPVVNMLARMPVSPIPGGLRFEPVDVDELAARLAELVLAEPVGWVPDVVGPDVLDIAHLLEEYTKVRGHRHPRLPVRIPGAIGRAYRAGDNLAGPDAQRGTHSWADFLADLVSTTPKSSGSVRAGAQ